MSRFRQGIALLAVALVAPGLARAWDKATTPDDRLKVVVDAVRLRTDHARLGACFGSPWSEGDLMKTILEAAKRYDEALSQLHEQGNLVLGPEVIEGVGLENVSALHPYVAAELRVESVAAEGEGRAVAKLAWKDPSFTDPVPCGAVLVNEGGDWRLLPPFLNALEPWPKADRRSATDLGIDLQRAYEKGAKMVEALTKEVTEQKVKEKADIAGRLEKAAEEIKKVDGQLQAAHGAALKTEREKAAAAAKPPEPTPDPKAPKDPKAAKTPDPKAAKTPDPKAAKTPDPKPAATPAPSPAPVAKTETPRPPKTDRTDKPDDEKKPEPDNTGTIVVFVILGLICAGVIGAVIMKAKEQNRGGGGGPRKGGRSARGGRPDESGRGSTSGRRKRR